jgi:hypothetical protein
VGTQKHGTSTSKHATQTFLHCSHGRPGIGTRLIKDVTTIQLGRITQNLRPYFSSDEMLSALGPALFCKCHGSRGENYVSNKTGLQPN